MNCSVRTILTPSYYVTSRSLVRSLSLTCFRLVVSLFLSLSLPLPQRACVRARERARARSRSLTCSGMAVSLAFAPSPPPHPPLSLWSAFSAGSISSQTFTPSSLLNLSESLRSSLSCHLPAHTRVLLALGKPMSRSQLISVKYVYAVTLPM